MEDRNLNEQESLALMIQMIQKSKRRISDGHGNLFLMWGYISIAVSLTIFLLIWFIPNSRWAWAWSAILVLGFCGMYFMRSKEEVSSMSYIDAIVHSVWRAVIAFIAGIAIMLYMYENYSLVLPVSQICVSLGMCVTGLILKDKYLLFCSNAGMMGAAFLLCYNDGRVTPATPFLFAMFMAVVLIASGYHLKKVAKQINKELKED